MEVVLTDVLVDTEDAAEEVDEAWAGAPKQVVSMAEDCCLRNCWVNLAIWVLSYSKSA